MSWPYLPDLGDDIDMIYNALDGEEEVHRYHQEHGTPSLLILTQHSPKVASEMARLIGPLIDGKRVVEIGAGVGYLAMEMAKRAQWVVAIEVDPAWSWLFTRHLYRHKPTNLTWIFGNAEAVAEWVRADVAIIMTRSGHREMIAIAEKMAPEVHLPLGYPIGAEVP